MFGCHRMLLRDLTHHNFAAAFNEVAETQIVGVFDYGEETRAEFVTTWSDVWPDVQTFDDYGRMFHELKPDIVCIATRQTMHADQVGQIRSCRMRNCAGAKADQEVRHLSMFFVHGSTVRARNGRWLKYFGDTRSSPVFRHPFVSLTGLDRRSASLNHNRHQVRYSARDLPEDEILAKTGTNFPAGVCARIPPSLEYGIPLPDAVV